MDQEGRAPEGSAVTKVQSRLKQDGPVPKKEGQSASTSPNESKPPSRDSSSSPGLKAENESTSTPDTEPASKASRKSAKARARSPPLFNHLPDATQESTTAFQVITDCLYGSKNMGASQHDALDCDCAAEWRNGVNHACGDDSDCINRATKMECVDSECNCGLGCENQRFQRKQFADVAVIKTEKKGYGLRANTDLQPNEFVFEYIGEVINEPTFRRRMMQYDQEGIKHFYFMSLTRSEFVDATKKGNLGRFCNHSCNPNCYVDKWVVGEKLRMGIFTSRVVRAGEELVFNYNVDRYGADPQPCYCGEPNCTGYIGGKTQTERATKLPLATIEALGIDDGDSWDTTVAKKPRKKKPTEDDEEYVNSVQLPSLDEDGVTKVMAALMQCKEKWIAVKLLQRIDNADDDRVRNRVVQMHGYQILKSTLSTFKDDNNIILQILNILWKFPRVSKNKISDSKIEAEVESLVASGHEDVAAEAKRLLEEWSKLETAYRIPRRKFDPTTQPVNSFEERRRQERAEQAPNPQGSGFAPGVVVPKGPKSNIPQRNAAFFSAQQQQRRRAFPPSNSNALPAGWHMAKDPLGNVYYYNSTGTTTWQRPTTSADTAKVPTKKEEEKKALQDIIDSLTKDPTPRPSASLTPQQSTPVQEAKKEKWRSLPVDKQMKIYENTLFPSVKYVVDKFRHKLPKELLKKHAKDVNKALVASDYKHNRVEDPTVISEKQVKKVKVYVRDFLDKAVVKHKEHEKHKVDREAKHGTTTTTTDTSSASKAVASVETPGPLNGDDDIVMSDVEDAPTSSPVKRKREEEDGAAMQASLTPDDMPSTKRVKEETPEEPSPPPPPPPLPDAAMGDDLGLAPSQVDGLRDDRQVEFSHEQEEAERLADEAEQDRVRQEEALQRENEEAMREFELEQTNQHVTTALNGYLAGSAAASAGSAEDDKRREYEQRSKQAIAGQ
ncbi:unnamed protein product [Discula destructiva]